MQTEADTGTTGRHVDANLTSRLQIRHGVDRDDGALDQSLDRPGQRDLRLACVRLSRAIA